ncbi:MAG: signal peptidase I [Cyclobacteriaceae bacterium]
MPVRHKTILQEWTDAIVFAVVAATLIRWLIMEAYTIPTPSMENSLLVGDFLFVSKFHYGTRTPRTPLQIPLTHQKIWFTEIPSYLNWIQLPSTRLPGFTTVKRYDVVVFNVPSMYPNNFDEPDRTKWISYPVDLKTPYIKRCVGVPGDVLEIKGKQLYINNEPAQNPEEMQFKYRVVSKDEINKRYLDMLQLDQEDIPNFGRTEEGVEYVMLLSAKKVDELKSLPFIKSVERLPVHYDVDSGIFPTSKYAPWNGDNYGPLTIPKKGMTISINDSTLSMYGSTIKDYDLNDEVKIEAGKLIIDGKEVTQYTFKQNYYFMMGDNRDNSLDSRYWGFVPEDHIVGKGFFIWLSLDKYSSYFNKIRWNRFFKMIK